VRCEHLADLLPGYDDAGAVDQRARRHVQRCLRCQADLVRYRRMRRLLASLGAETLVPPDDLLVALMLDLDEAAEVGSGSMARRRLAYLGGLAAATAAGVGGVLVLAARGRRVAG